MIHTCSMLEWIRDNPYRALFGFIVAYTVVYAIYLASPWRYDSTARSLEMQKECISDGGYIDEVSAYLNVEYYCVLQNDIRYRLYIR